MIHNTGDKFVIEIGEVIERHGEPPKNYWIQTV